MRYAILSAPTAPVITGPWANGAHPAALPLLSADRQANGEAFPDERVVRLPRRFSRMYPFEIARELGRA